jgi:TolA-binding protein
MRERRLRWPLLMILCLLLPITWSCNLPSSGPSSSQAGSSSETEKTRKIEEKAAEIDRHAEELRNMQGSEQEKIDAMNRLDQERRELNEMQEQSGSK